MAAARTRCGASSAVHRRAGTENRENSPMQSRMGPGSAALVRCLRRVRHTSLTARLWFDHLEHHLEGIEHRHEFIELARVAVDLDQAGFYRIGECSPLQDDSIKRPARQRNGRV